MRSPAAGRDRISQLGVLLFALWQSIALAPTASAETVWLVQVPMRCRPSRNPISDVSVAPNTSPLSAEELQRAEALLPLLEGKQEFWAMGEFVPPVNRSCGPDQGPAMPGPRIDTTRSKRCRC
ncbi:MAG: hypothetical protein U0361_05490 [Nitrospiraceae bacterium]